MTQHTHSLAETTVASPESSEHSSMFPIIDVLDEVLPPSSGCVASSRSNLQVSLSPTTDPRLRLKCLLVLGKVCVTHGILPRRYPRINNFAAFGDNPNASGGSADVWRGEVDGRQVAVKVTRRYSTVPISQAREVNLHLGSPFFSH